MVAQILLISAFCLPSVLLQESPVDLKAIQKSAQALATATKKGDVATLLEGSYPKAVEMMGVKDAAEKAIRSAMDDFGKKGITFTKAECSEPKEIQKVRQMVHRGADGVGNAGSQRIGHSPQLPAGHFGGWRQSLEIHRWFRIEKRQGP